MGICEIEVIFLSALKYWIWLSTVKGIGAATASKLLDKMGNPENIFFADKDTYLLNGISEKDAEKLMDKSLGRAMSVMDSCYEKGIRILVRDDAEYPERLKNIYDPPVVLYIKGTLPVMDEEAAVAVAGTRSCTPYGIKTAERMGYELTREGCLVVSGLAKGIDSAAAKGALRAGGKVVGVMGCGIDIIYPYENKRLFEDVVSVGAIISEYPPGTEVNGKYFPARNRIISGIAAGVVIIEAPKKSGSLITASRALEQGRDVFAVPANADSLASEGSNILIREGAIPVICGKDVADEYRNIYPEKIKSSKALVPLSAEEEKKLIKTELSDKKESIKVVKKVIDKKNNGDYDLKQREISLSEEERSLCDVIGSECIHVNDVIEKSGMATGKVLALLTMLEIKGAVIQENGKMFRLS